MSLGFWICGEKISDLKEALEEALRNRIVAFGATFNGGAYKPKAWPANDLHLAIDGVHSCTDGGTTKPSFTAQPDDNGVNFIVVGENILSQRLTSLGGGFTLARARQLMYLVIVSS